MESEFELRLALQSWIFPNAPERVQVNGANQRREILLFRRPFLNLPAIFILFPHRLLGRDESSFPCLTSASHLVLFKQFHPQNMFLSFNMAVRRGHSVGSGAPRRLGHGLSPSLRSVVSAIGRTRCHTGLCDIGVVRQARNCSQVGQQ
jgi:hypothetical protein